MEHISEKLQKYLKMIVESYISLGEPIGSNHLKKIYNLDSSPSTIRSIMAQLEDFSLLEKSHISSGRIPSILGYEYYAKYLAKDNDENLINKLEDVFAKRRISIDQTIEEAARIISEIAGITLITTTNSDNEKLKNIQLTILDETSAVIILVSSTGRVENKLLHFNNNIEKEDVKIAIRIFKERLIDAPLKEIPERIRYLSPILSREVKNLEKLISTFISEVFTFSIEYRSKVFNKNNLILSPEISREKLTDILDLIENKSIWETIEGKIEEDQNLKIIINSKEASFISKKIDANNKTSIREITVVGSTKRMDYSAALTGIKLIENFLKKEK